MWGSIRCSLLLVLVLVLAAISMPALSSPAPAAAASTNIIHHGGGARKQPGERAGGGGEREPDGGEAAGAAQQQGLGCMALQYLAHCLTAATNPTCGTELSSSCHPPERDVTEVYAANCGVELPTVDLISARLLGCFIHDNDEDSVLVIGANASRTVRGKEHTQVGAGMLRPRRHGPDFWCLLFSAGKPGTTFRLEAAGQGHRAAAGLLQRPRRRCPRLQQLRRKTAPRRLHASAPPPSTPSASLVMDVQPALTLPPVSASNI